MPRSAENKELYDAHLLGILQNEENIQNFLDVIFSFLQRKTDFFIVMKDKFGKMGFPEGEARKLVNAILSKHEHIAKARQAKQNLRQAPKCSGDTTTSAKLPKVGSNSNVCTATASTAVVAPSHSPSQTRSTGTASASMKSMTKEKEHTKVSLGANTGTETGISDIACATDSHINANQPQTRLEEKSEEKTDDHALVPQPHDRQVKDQGDVTMMSQDTSSIESCEGDADDNQQKVYQADSHMYNGAERDSYAWSQTITDLDVRVKIPPEVKKGNQVQVDISAKHLRASYKDSTSIEHVEWQTIVDEDLCWPINKEESMWTLVPGEHIHVNLEKRQERWWEAVLMSEPKINIRAIDASRPMTDLDDEAKAKVNEMMFNEQQKKLGKPQSHEIKVHDMLRQAWDTEGSPFKGQPFDPSVVNVMPGASGS